jgi:hypothetical protein
MITPDLEKVLTDIRNEREHQLTRWSTDHDDSHQTHQLVKLAEQYAHKCGKGGEEGYYDRHRLVQAATLLVAAIEAMDRRDARR